jgi:hypothetical protein
LRWSCVESASSQWKLSTAADTPCTTPRINAAFLIPLQLLGRLLQRYLGPSTRWGADAISPSPILSSYGALQSVSPCRCRLHRLTEPICGAAWPSRHSVELLASISQPMAIACSAPWMTLRSGVLADTARKTGRVKARFRVALPIQIREVEPPVSLMIPRMSGPAQNRKDTKQLSFRYSALNGGPRRTRTYDPLIKSHVGAGLSKSDLVERSRGIWEGWARLNFRLADLPCFLQSPNRRRYL